MKKQETQSARGMPVALRAAAPDEEARAFLRFFNLFARRPLAEYSMPELRQLWRLIALALGRRDPVASVTDHTIEGPAGNIELRIFRTADGTNLPALLWCHGGGFVVGGVETTDSICRNLARTSGAAVVAVRYRLAPEHDLYAGREDVLAAIDWLARHGTSVWIDPDRLAIGGDSAGGNLAAAVAQECVRRGGPPLLLQVLAYPATTVGKDFPSKAENSHGYLLTAESMDWMKRVIAASVDLEDHWISPGLNPDLKGAPPALIVTAGFDPIRDDGLNYASRLRVAGTCVELLHYPGQFHGFLNFDAILGAARDGLDRTGAALYGAFHGVQPPDRTVEIGDRAASRPRPVRGAATQVVTATLMVWESVEQWGDTLLRLASPPAATAAAWACWPWLAPVRWARGAVNARLNRLQALQTHPAAGSSS
ncbi:MAG: alpha/beta hydrolase [Variovorax sp.]